MHFLLFTCHFWFPRKINWYSSKEKMNKDDQYKIEQNVITSGLKPKIFLTLCDNFLTFGVEDPITKVFLYITIKSKMYLQTLIQDLFFTFNFHKLDSQLLILECFYFDAEKLRKTDLSRR